MLSIRSELMGKAEGIIRIIRPVNCVMMGFAVFVGAVLASPSSLANAWLSILYGFLTGFTLTGASMAINDYYDRKIDAINEPLRPIPSGAVKSGEAIALALVLSAVGFIASYLVSIACLVVAVIAWVVFTTYVTVGKRSGLPGNFLVSVCVATPFIYGSIIITGGVQLNVWLFALMAFLSNTGREITKGIVDVQGDSAEGVKTIAVRYGERKAAIIAAAFYLTAVSLTPLPWLLMLVSFWFIPVVIITDVGFILSSVLLLRDYSRKNSRKIKKLVLLWFVTGLLAFIFGILL